MKHRIGSPTVILLVLQGVLFASVFGQVRPRARDLGIPFSGKIGPLNSITDVPGVEIGHITLIAGDGKLVVGDGPVRTGVTALLPRGNDDRDQRQQSVCTAPGSSEGCAEAVQ